MANSTQVYTSHEESHMNTEPSGKEIFSILKLFPNKLLLAITFIIAMLVPALPILMTVFGSNMITEMSTSIDFLGAVRTLALKMFGIVLAICVAQCINYGIRSYAMPIFETTMRTTIYNNLMNQQIEFFDTESSGIFISRLSEDVATIRKVYFDDLLGVVEGAMQTLLSVIIAFTCSWIVTLAACAAIPIIAGSMAILQCWQSKVEKAQNTVTEDAAKQSEEVITQFRTVKSYDNELYEYKIFSDRLQTIENANNVYAVIQGVRGFVMQLITAGVIAAVTFLCTHLIMKEPKYNLEAGDIVLLMMLLSVIAVGMQMTLTFFNTVPDGNKAAAKILQLVNLTSPVDMDAGKELTSVKGKIEFRDVSFKYKTSETPALNHLSLTVNPGETVAIVGESGCGKSTTLSLLQHLYELEEGDILIDGQSLKEISPRSIRSKVAIVSQTPVLFSMSILDNIRYSNSNAPSKDAEDAAIVGNAHSFITELKDGYETVVSQMGLSGGQKQRLCISRAILANKPILLLDEATAALDTESEQLVQKSLESVRGGKTTIIVAHRLATVMSADRIFVMSKGSIIESGTHKELLEANGAYANLVKFQLQ